MTEEVDELGPRRIGGLVLVIIGAGLCWSGYELSQTVGNQIGQAFSGSNSDEVVMRYVAGAACAAVGGYLAR